jgi:Replication stress response SDE2 C-terminal
MHCTPAQALGMKCGGTLEQRAERLMSVKGLKPSEIDPKVSQFLLKKHDDTAVFLYISE